jgi:RecA/RadA recombinase
LLPHSGDTLRSMTFAEALEGSSTLGTLGTGSPSLDQLLGGGYEQGKITEAFGASNSGKTQLAMQATVTAAARGWMSVYVDTESTFRPERVAEMAESRGLSSRDVLDMVFSIRAEDVAAQSNAVQRMTDDPRVSAANLVVVDTVTKNFSLEFPGNDKVGKRQGALGVYLNRLAIDAYLHKRVVLLTNRVASVTRDGRSEDVSVGGLTLGRFLSKAVRLRREEGWIFAELEFPRDGRPPTRCALSQQGLV